MNDDACPKHMVFGPCGGVRDDHGCEVDGRPCPFVDRALPATPRRTPLPLPFPADGRTLVVDVRAPRRWAGDARRLWRDVAAALDGCVALLGEHVDNPPRTDDSGALAPEHVVEILASGGAPPIVTVTGRDRGLALAAAQMARYRDAGAAAVHCVTGDHPRAMGIERPVSFGAEAMTLIGVAIEVGLAVTVGESPASPGARADRVRAKAAAGAAACILNHAGGPDELIAFAGAVGTAGTTPALFAPVPMVASAHDAAALQAFPGLRLAPGHLEAILAAADPEREGVRAAVELARTIASARRFAGMNVSGGGHHGDPYRRLRTTTRYLDALRDL